MENCQINRFLTIWQNIIFGPKFMTQGTQTYYYKKLDGSFPLITQVIYPTGVAPERAVSGGQNLRKCVQFDYRYGSTLKKEHFLCRTALDFFVIPDNQMIYGTPIAEIGEHGSMAPGI